jgi:hypothetical protein
MGIKQIANVRGVSPNTVKAQINSAKLKLNVGTAQGLTAKCITLNLLILTAFLLTLFFTLKNQNSVITQLPEEISNIEITKTL